MNVGPGGALGFVAGDVAIHASNATLNSGRNRRAATSIAVWFPTEYAAYHAEKVDESKLRRSSAVCCARFACDRDVADSASFTRDSVLHFAAPYPDQAPVRATTASRTASATESSRS